MEKILIVVDMQKDFIDGSLGTAEAVSIIQNVCDKIEKFEGKIYVTKDTHDDNYLNTNEGRNLPVVHCIRNSEGWQLDKAIEKALSTKDYEIVEKPGFGSLELPEIIRKDFPDINFEIEIVGLCTDICVVSNAIILKANFPENTIKVDSKCCAGVTPDSHEAALMTMKMCQIFVE